jgi:hypothetical protein
MNGLDPNDPVVRAIQASIGQNETVLSRLNAHLQGLIPTFIEEFGVSDDPGESAAGSLVLNPERDTFFKVTGLYVSLPLNTVSASLQLGNLTLPLQNTTTLLTPIQRILRSTDVRKLLYTTGSENGGTATLWLWGDAHPSYGKM